MTGKVVAWRVVKDCAQQAARENWDTMRLAVRVQAALSERRE
ncbi:MAG: hypothetical protein Q8N47_12835 [Bryobacterales bacterium]|nr:hypothetical protein [Bryobacterales bacterium]